MELYERNGEMKMQFVIYDDHPDASATLKSMLQPMLPSSVRIDCANTLTQANKTIGEGTDVVFQDIELDTAKNGIRFAQELQKRFPRLRFVFITAYTEYYEEIFAVEPIAFMRKPFRPEGLQICLEQLERHLHLHSQQVSVTLTKNHILSLELSDVEYIENCNRRLLFRKADDTVKYTLRMRMTDLEPLLPSNFARCHQSFCVNMGQVAELRRFCFVMKNGQEIAVSGRRFAETRQQYLSYLGSQL